MLKRALISGIPGTGINVLDLGTVPIPVLRHFVRNDDEVTAGIHVRISPFDQRVVDMRLVNGEGTNLNTAEQREIERAFFREDFRRAYLDEIGIIRYASERDGQNTSKISCTTSRRTLSGRPSSAWSSTIHMDWPQIR